MIEKEVLIKLADGQHPKYCGCEHDGEFEPLIVEMAKEILLLQKENEELELDLDCEIANLREDKRHLRAELEEWKADAERLAEAITKISNTLYSEHPFSVDTLMKSGNVALESHRKLVERDGK